MKVRQYSAVLGLVLTLGIQSVQADCGTNKPDGCGKGCNRSCQPANLCCQNTLKTRNVKKHCYDVECSYVCIPPVTLPARLCPFFRSSKNCGRDIVCGECGVEGCQDCLQCRSEPGILRRLCSKLTDGRIRKVRKMKKKNTKSNNECANGWSSAGRILAVAKTVEMAVEPRT